MNLQDELQIIHNKYGTSEKANYEIQKKVDELIQQERDKTAIAIFKDLEEVLYEEDVDESSDYWTCVFTSDYDFVKEKYLVKENEIWN